MMVNFQRRVSALQSDTIKKDDSGKIADKTTAPKNEMIDDKFKSPTEKLLSRYFDVEI